MSEYLRYFCVRGDSCGNYEDKELDEAIEPYLICDVCFSIMLPYLRGEIPGFLDVGVGASYAAPSFGVLNPEGVNEE